LEEFKENLCPPAFLKTNLDDSVRSFSLALRGKVSFLRF
jgi:hypothetical protein